MKEELVACYCLKCNTPKTGPKEPCKNCFILDSKYEFRKHLPPAEMPSNTVGNLAYKNRMSMTRDGVEKLLKKWKTKKLSKKEERALQEKRYLAKLELEKEIKNYYFQRESSGQPLPDNKWDYGFLAPRVSTLEKRWKTKLLQECKSFFSRIDKGKS